MASEPEFYVGWQEQMPASIKQRVRSALLVLSLAGLAAGAVIAATQNRLDIKTFEFGTTREFVGWIQEKPYPTLLVVPPGQSDQTGSQHRLSRYQLNELGTKYGAQEIVAGLDGQMVRFQGTLIYRGDQTLVDVEADSIAALDSITGLSDVGAVELGHVVLQGEIVDTKCYYGVMNPATGKVHRACAARCISSGVPPGLLVRDAEGRSATLLLVDAEGRSVNERVLDLVAESVEIAGRVVRHDNLLVLHSDPETYKRLE
jgi:hypothetical protein